MNRQLTAKAEVLIIVLLACVPLFIHFPYRVNIFLSWEGAYRISQGQVPFRDFGLPLGGMYWLIPAFFFKLFGAKLITLVKAQIFINIVAGLSFRSILRSLSVNRGIRLSSVLLFCLSYSFFNFWPWYNHSVIVYELVALAFLFRAIRVENGEGVVAGANEGGVVAGRADSIAGRAGTNGNRHQLAWLAGAAFFTGCSFLTKQDGGGLAFLVAGVVLAAYGWVSGKWKPLLLFVGIYVVLLFLMVLPFLSNGFGYWFNHGQTPHSSRVSPFDIAAEFFGSSQWIKFYFFLTVLLAVVRYRRWGVLKADRQGVLLLVLTWGILVEAAVLQVTSYTPPDNNIFFHSFAFAGILSLLAPLLPAGWEKPRMTVMLVAGVLLWWSGVWWKYTERLTGPLLARQPAGAVSPTGENVVNKDSYMINRDTATDIPTEQWIECGLPAFSKITLPAPTVAGIHRLMDMDLVKRAREGEGLRVLNMSELTPLAAEIPFALEKNGRLPLWYHLGVGMFNRQADTFETRIRQHYYDLVLFEYIPTLNNFYPFRVRDSLHLHYSQVDSFMAPRRGLETQGVVEVYVRPVQ